MDQAAASIVEGMEDLLRRSAIYRKLDQLGLCDLVRCFFLQGRDGAAGSLIVADRTQFLVHLLALQRFCRDSQRGAMLHGGQRSFREITLDDGEALHFTFGSGDHVRVHVDHRSPSVGVQGDGSCRYGRRRTAAHIRRDVVPLLLAPGRRSHPRRATPARRAGAAGEG
jgi:hypothetical protein